MNRIRLYFKIFCQYPSLFLIAIFFLAVTIGCHPSVIIPVNVTVFSEKSLDPHYRSAKLAIVPFNTAVMKPDLGITVGKIFEIEIIKRRFFESTVMIEDTPWDKQLTIAEQKIRAAVIEARQRKADLLLWGDVEEFQVGTLSRPEVTIHVMLIDVRTSSLLWWGRGKTSGMPGNTFLFLGHTPPEEAPPVEELIEHVAEKVSKSMLSEANQFWGKTIVKRCQTVFKKFVSMRGAEQEQKKPLSIETPIQRTQENELQEPKKYMNDIIDDALNELESMVLE